MGYAWAASGGVDADGVSSSLRDIEVFVLLSILVRSEFVI
jgi:hypothetical protein